MDIYVPQKMDLSDTGDLLTLTFLIFSETSQSLSMRCHDIFSGHSCSLQDKL